MDINKTFCVVDDHSLMLNGIINFLENKNWKCLGQAQTLSDGEILIQNLNKKSLLPQILISDINLTGTTEGIKDGFVLAKYVSENFPQVLCVAYSILESSSIIQGAMNSGFKGYVGKSSSPEELLKCMTYVLNGGTYLQENFILPLKHLKKEIDCLSKREKSVFNLILQNKDNREIALKLNLQKHVVENYVSMIYDKLNVKNRKELLKKYEN